MNNTLSGIVFYNLWGHRYPGHLQRYLKKLAPTTDIFCFTEVTDYDRESVPAPIVHMGDPKKEPPARVDGLRRLEQSLYKDYFWSYHSPQTRDWRCQVTGNVYQGVGFGSALFYHDNLDVIDMGNEPIQFENTDVSARVMQWIVYQKGGQRYVVGHLHGIWIPTNTKGDAPERYWQSQKVREVLQQLKEKFQADKIVFGGDLNLALETLALKTLVEGDEGEDSITYRNLIVEYGVKNTRTQHYRKFEETGASQHADYVIVSPSVQVHSFTVGNDVPASDHAPLRIEFR